ncbi:MAG: glycoside hydrolase family 55 protein [Victivallaceae bacterium]|nr:glycoside hydrolase family 55 protein [Victivallaceae bacterium]
MKFFTGTGRRAAGTLFFALISLALAGCASTDDWKRDHSLDEFPAFRGETDDAPRIRRAIQTTPDGVLTIPRGTYRIATPIVITNNCSLEMNKGAVLKAVAPMDVMVTIHDKKRTRDDAGSFSRGGVLDGNGMASCLNVRDSWLHYTLSEIVLLNGKEYGLLVDRGCEIVCNNLYAKCTLPGLAGNAAFVINGGDSYYNDCHAVDYTIGYDVRNGGSNRLTRCHSWGGLIPPPKPGEPCEMLKDSVNFRIGRGATATILRDCYADTGLVGYAIDGCETRMLGCSYFSNTRYTLDGITVVKHTNGRLLVSDGAFFKCAEGMKVYDGCGTVEWRDMSYWGWKDGDDCPGALEYRGNATGQKFRDLAK